MAAGILILSSNKVVKAWQLESPLVALFIGLLLGNFALIADKLKEVLRTEYYVKIGIILMGATLPFTTILSGSGRHCTSLNCFGCDFFDHLFRSNKSVQA